VADPHSEDTLKDFLNTLHPGSTCWATVIGFEKR
jgi:hypothetical protein